MCTSLANTNARWLAMEPLAFCCQEAALRQHPVTLLMEIFS